MYDPELYRTKEEVEEWKKRDPIPALIAKISAGGTGIDAEVAEIEAQVAKEVEEAIAFAEAGTLEPVSDLTRFVYSERSAV